MRPDKEDLSALRILLQREDLSDWAGEFVETLRNWQGNWTAKQGAAFDELWGKYFE